MLVVSGSAKAIYACPSGSREKAYMGYWRVRSGPARLGPREF